MNCQEFWSGLPHRAGTLTEEQSEHLAECAVCGAEWEPHRNLADHLHSLIEEWRKTEAPPRVEAGLLAACRASRGFERSRRASWWTPVFAWATATAAMMALAVVLIHGYRPSAGPTPGTVATPAHFTQPAAQMASVDADSDDDSGIPDEGFVRIPNVPPLQPGDEYNVVEAEVAGSEMIKMGVPVSEERASEKLLAELVIGPDGTTRAVKLVGDGGTY